MAERETQTEKKRKRKRERQRQIMIQMFSVIRDRRVTECGAQAHINSGHPAVKWCIKVDPRGDRNHAEYSFTHRCKHVSLVEKARLPHVIPRILVLQPFALPCSALASFVVFWVQAHRPHAAAQPVQAAVGVPAEQEFLFAPYSAFTVVAVHWSDTPDDATPHRIVLSAATDNRRVQTPNLPLAPWS